MVRLASARPSPSSGQHRRLHISSSHILFGHLRPPSPGPATSSLSSDQSHRLRAFASSAVSEPFPAPLSPDPDKLRSPAPGQLRRLQTCSSSTAVSRVLSSLAVSESWLVPPSPSPGQLRRLRGLEEIRRLRAPAEIRRLRAPSQLRRLRAPGPEANIIKKKDKLLGRFIPYLTCKIRNKDTQYVVLKKHDILGIFIPYFTRQIWNKTAQ